MHKINHGRFTPMCDLCHKVLKEGDQISATITGEIKDAQFKPDEDTYIKIMCEICADQVSTVSAELDRVMELLERAG